MRAATGSTNHESSCLDLDRIFEMQKHNNEQGLDFYAYYGVYATTAGGHKHVLRDGSADRILPLDQVLETPSRN